MAASAAGVGLQVGDPGAQAVDIASAVLGLGVAVGGLAAAFELDFA